MTFALSGPDVEREIAAVRRGRSALTTEVALAKQSSLPF